MSDKNTCLLTTAMNQTTSNFKCPVTFGLHIASLTFGISCGTNLFDFAVVDVFDVVEDDDDMVGLIICAGITPIPIGPIIPNTKTRLHTG